MNHTKRPLPGSPVFLRGPVGMLAMAASFLACAGDASPPDCILSGAPDVNVPGGTEYEVQVTCSDDIGVDLASLDDDDVTVESPDGDVSTTLTGASGFNTLQGNGISDLPVFSADGRFVAFASEADNLVADDTNGAVDVFVYDRRSGAVERVSVDSVGNQANGPSGTSNLNIGSFPFLQPPRFLGLAIGGDGRYVAFPSEASNLVAGDTNNALDVFVHDRLLKSTTRVSVVNLTGGEGNGASGTRGVAISTDGRSVAFGSLADNLVAGDTNGAEDAFVHDLGTGITERVSVDSDENESAGGGDIRGISISGAGDLVAFASEAPDLVAGDTNGEFDVFVRDRPAGETTRVSVDSAGAEADGDTAVPAFSADGRILAFASEASNLVVGDTNGIIDVFVHELDSGETERVSVDSAGGEAVGGTPLFVDASSFAPSLSAAGRFVAFGSFATNLVPDDTNGIVDTFVRDRDPQTGPATDRVSVSSAGDQAVYTGGALSLAGLVAAIDGAGRYVAFSSQATNLVSGDTNAVADVFVRDTLGASTVRIEAPSAAGSKVSRVPVVTITYALTPPGGSWDATDNGIYEVRLNGDQISDAAGNAGPAQVLGAFNVGIDADLVFADGFEASPGR